MDAKGELYTISHYSFFPLFFLRRHSYVIFAYCILHQTAASHIEKERGNDDSFRLIRLKFIKIK